LGKHRELVGELRELVREQPMRERIWAQLMICLYRCGQQADALGTFAHVRQLLIDELGVEPSPTLTEVHHAVLNQDPALRWPPPTRQIDLTPATAARLLTSDHADSGHAAGVEALEGDPLRRGMAALQRRDWARARTLLAAADAQTELAGEALDGLAEAAMWIGEYESSLATRQRAHAAFVNNGNRRRAALTAIALAMHYAARLRFAVAAGWYGRAERLLADQPESAEQGYLAWTACLMSIGARQEAPALDAARRTFKIGLHTGDPTLQALGIAFQGYLSVRAGDVDEGLRMLDEGMAAAVGGTLAPFPTSLIFCRLIDTCQQLGDYRRAAEWLEAIDNSPITACITSYPGDCDTHRAQLLVGRGAWSEAEQLARRACASMQKFDVGHAGLAFYQLGEVRLRTGDLAGAEAAFARAAELGTVPQPGAALLDRRNGRLARAAETLAVALADEPWDALARARLLPTEVQLAVEIGDPERARRAAGELAELAETYPSKAIMAAAATAAGRLSLAEGNARAAASALRKARQLWAESAAPYEAAAARVVLARALADNGQSQLAVAELGQARAAFERLGAAPDAQAADAVVAELASQPVKTGP
jgi:tetratricopeptide (TPR) repeat protein